MWISIVLAIFFVWLVAGDFGKPPAPVVSPISARIFSLYTTTYIGAGIVASIFLGTMIFFVYRFRVREDYREG
ncbi:MAG: respiratory chain protein (SoxI-like) [Thermoproteus sp.]